MKNLRSLGAGLAVVFFFAGPALAEGDAAKGKEAYAAKCAPCHQVGAGAQNLVGPELNKIVGRKAASVSGFAYSPGMKKLGDEGFVWNVENLDQWIADPKAMLPESPMSQLYPAMFPDGLPDAQARADIIAYLKTQ